MKRLARLPLALLAFAAACGEGTPTAPVTASPSALTPGKPSFDLVGNDVDASIDAAAEVMALNVDGANGTTQLYISPTNGDGKNGCNLTGSTTLVVSVSSSNAAVATVSPSSVTFASCGDVKTLTVTPLTVGTTTISVTQTSNNTGGTFDFSGATFTVNVAPPANTAPSIVVAGVTPGASYDKGSVPAATCQVTDAEDGNSTFPAVLSTITGPYASDGIGSQTASCSYTDGGGQTASASVTYSIVDPSAPIIGYTLNPTSPDGSSGWYKSNVSLTWSVVESESPSSLVRTGCVDQNITVDQAATTYTCSSTSAGGAATEVSVTVKRDATAPTASASQAPAANAHGWNNTAVTVTFTGTDATSGLASCSADVVLSSEGAGQPASGTCTDLAGNVSAQASVSVNIDKTAPAVSPTDVVNTTWRNTPLSQTFTASDNLSGLANPADASFTLIASNESANAATPTEASNTVTDKAGNSITRKVSALIDLTKPTVSGVSFFDPDIPVGSSANLTATVGDVLSGLNKAEYSTDGGQTWSPTSMNITGTTATASISALTAGLYNVCVRSTDNAGNVSAPGVASCAYLAVYDPNGGFVTGGGWINSPENACRNWSGCTAQTVGKANFGFVSKYLPGRTTAPEGSTEFQFQAGNLRFKSTSYETLIVAGDRAQFWGVGTVNGGGSFAFRLTAVDGTPDRFRMEIWNGARDDNGAKIYDNQWGAAQDAALTTAIGGGSIQIKR